MDKNNRLIVIIIGPPGSGKGTQSLLLADKLGLYYFEASKVIEEKIKDAQEGDYEEVNGKKYSLAEERRKWEEGEICDSELVFHWVKDKIKKLAGENQDIVFAGNPRRVVEAELLMPLLDDLYKKENIKIILLKLSEKDSIWRNTHRRFCRLMRHPILYNEDTKDLKTCPLDGSELYKRELDDAETMKVRLEAYEKETLPLVEYFKKNDYQVNEINAGETPADIFHNILKTLDVKW